MTASLRSIQYSHHPSIQHKILLRNLKGNTAILYMGIIALLLKSSFNCAKSVSGGSNVSSVSSVNSVSSLNNASNLYWGATSTSDDIFFCCTSRGYWESTWVVIPSCLGHLVDHSVLCVRVTCQDGHLSISFQHFCYWPLWKIIFLHPSWSTSLYLLTQNTVDWWCNHYNGGGTYCLFRRGANPEVIQ